MKDGDFLDARIEAYNAERNKMLLKCSVDAYLRFAKRHKLKVPSTRAAALVTIHKTRTAINSLPLEERLLSKKWLTERGYSSLDDGELG